MSLIEKCLNQEVSFYTAIEMFEKEIVEAALAKNSNLHSRTAVFINVNRSTLLEIMDRVGIERIGKMTDGIKYGQHKGREVLGYWPIGKECIRCHCLSVHNGVCEMCPSLERIVNQVLSSSTQTSHPAAL